MVFQNYALYPHMTVQGNIGYSLRIAGVSKKERQKKVDEVAQILDLSHLLNRKPGQLSGGQRQRVAIGRALVREPELFLFDEPLSNLDAKLRNSTRIELKKLHDKLGATTIYVTHDQVEAMTLADRIIILNNGIIEQIGTPKEIYSQPATCFVAGFIGTPQTNLINGVINEEKTKFMESGGSVFNLANHTLPTYREGVVLGIRPEDVTIGGSTVNAGIELVEELGSHRILHCRCGDAQISVVDSSEQLKSAGEEIMLGFPQEKIHFFAKESGRQLNG
jgi:sn-glycerol 3-phosphate transport system ATP-binding protein